jgi:hypothetical protein
MGVVMALNIVRTRAPVTSVGAELMIITSASVAIATLAVSIAKEGRFVYPPWRVEAPAERAVENAVSGMKVKAEK